MSSLNVSPSDREKLKRHTRGSTPARIAKRARALLELAEGRSISEVAERVGCGTATVKRVKARFLSGGLERVLTDAHRGGRPPKLDEAAIQELVALACSDPPAGHARWTISLLVEHSPVPVGRATVHKALDEHGIKPWREKNVVRTID